MSKLAKFDAATFDIEGLQCYIKQNRDELLSKIMLGGRTLERVSIRRDIKTSEAIHFFDMPVVFQDGRGCKFTPDGEAAVLTDRVLQTALIKVNKEFCPDDLLGSYAEALVRIRATAEELPFEEYIADYIRKAIEAELEKAIWQGDTDGSGNLSFFDGYLKLIAGEADTIQVAVSGSAYAKIKAVYAAMPEETLNQRDAAIFVGPALFREYLQDLVAANLYHYPSAQNEDPDEFILPGSTVPVVKTMGLAGSSAIVGTFSRNLFYGCDTENDKRELVIGYDEKAGSFFVRVRWNSGVQTAFPDQIVLGDGEPVIPVESIDLDRSTMGPLQPGQTGQLTADVLPSDATDPTVTWESSDEDIATVDENGLVTAVADGDAVIIAKAGDKLAVCIVSVAS